MRFKTLKNTKKELQEKQAIRETVLSRMAMCSEKELYTQLDAGRFGLSSEKAEEKLEEFGYNEIATPHETTIFSRLLHSLVNPFNVVLFLVAGISFFTDVLLSTEKDYATSVIILTLILFSSAIAFWQGEKSNSAAEKLTEMISNKADVWRDGRLLELPIDEIVPGDVVKLSAGDMLPGDVRFVSAKDAFVAQAALTGESAPVEKFTQV
ncbi:MAG: cation-transporting P-type ATPase, partial [Oscillospiraceae bacterium]|nr:cation-transporting P-type ATPase [Oscillospiraceae bacterium]